MASGSSTRPPTKHHKAIKFSQLEEELIALLPADGSSIDTHALAAAYFSPAVMERTRGKVAGELPLNARAIIVGRLRGIAAKAERAGLPWRVMKTARSGPRAMSFWRKKV